jgi:DNA-binding transcriptional LysR family regulator
MKKVAGTDATLLDVKLLRCFDLLYRTGRLTRVAEELGQSQPTVSIWLAMLRRALNDPLFVRTPGGMQPTPRADVLIPTVRTVLESLRTLSDVTPEFVPATSQRHFRLSVTDATLVTLLPILFAHVRAVAPRVRLEAARISSDTARSLQSGKSDLAIGLIPELESGFYQQVLFDSVWVCLVNPRHPRIGRTLTSRAYRDEAHVGIVYGTGQRLLEAALKHHRVKRNVLLELPTFLGLPAILSTTDLIATLPNLIGETLAHASGLAVFPCPVQIPPFTVKQHWHERYHHDPGNRWLRGICAALFMTKGARDRVRHHIA